ncbi:unnamed protein product, partial [Polarella glacialis]
ELDELQGCKPEESSLTKPLPMLPVWTFTRFRICAGRRPLLELGCCCCCRWWWWWCCCWCCCCCCHGMKKRLVQPELP